MCLGSIAALQYYFARTGLLDGKGAQLARDSKGAIKVGTGAAATDDAGGGADREPDAEAMEPVMEPPTVSTYRLKELITQPLPDMPLLRRQLREALDAAGKVLEDSKAPTDGKKYESLPAPHVEGVDTPQPQNWEEAQGLCVLDKVTLAIRQARMYYVTHVRPQNLYAVRPEREIRSDLYQVLDILKRMATRGFRGGIRDSERSDILAWIQGIRDLLAQEASQEAEEMALRAQCAWREGDWTGRENEREWLFLRSFDLEPSPLPKWEAKSSQPSEFLQALSQGLRLVRLHNEMVRRSNRTFGEITTFFTDLAKPYRCAENLRYWAKAAELRWEIKLNFSALDVVHGHDEQAWQRFDQAVMAWCKGVREEISKDWADAEEKASLAPVPAQS